MEAANPASTRGRLPAWVLGLVPLALLALAVAALALLDGPGLGDRKGVPVEEIAIERTELHPGRIELTIRNDGPDPVTISQISVADAFVPFSGAGEIGRLGSRTLTIDYPWIEGESYGIFLLTSTGGTIETAIDAAAESPDLDLGFFGLMALLGIYVGVIPVSIGMVWLPFIRRVGPAALRFLMAFTIGLLGFLGLDAILEGIDIAGGGPQVFGGSALVFIGAAVAYLALAALDSHMRARRRAARDAGAGGAYMALLIAIGIGLHNLGEGLAIGSAYAAGALALGAFLVVGFAIHNTTEGLAIVAPLADERPALRRLLLLGLVAGTPAVLGAWIGAAAFNTSVVALLLGAGAGAIIQVIVQLAPTIRDRAGRSLTPQTVAGIFSGVALLYVTGLLISV
ncbi:MAG: ZIP family metal transporter [Thermoleophilia bacterium]|nr:ZIP family metal transporter [Thermoleophilia bacterium]